MFNSPNLSRMIWRAIEMLCCIISFSCIANTDHSSSHNLNFMIAAGVISFVFSLVMLFLYNHVNFSSSEVRPFTLLELIGSMICTFLLIVSGGVGTQEIPSCTEHCSKLKAGVAFAFIGYGFFLGSSVLSCMTYRNINRSVEYIP
eukprot:TRINITY_DN8955_c0_g1_i1.p1 TRINITY_DN8955_c0_g1~~TRINITY_DN8955_c0_g1_i1.p1  ORF type:complete len:156 (+),score=19.30 TRINITY_DN8955_c0_g1_i1:36-470(+)